MNPNLKATVLDLVQWIVVVNDDAIEGIVDRFPPRSQLLSDDLPTYQVRHDGEIYHIKMPRSRTFDAFLEFSEGGDEDMITYELTPISDLQEAIKSIMTDYSELPTAYQRYILDYLDLRSSTYETSYDHRCWLKGSSVRVDLSMIGTLFHGPMEIDIFQRRLFDSVVDTKVNIQFKYGRLASVSIPETLKLTYNNGDLEYPLKSWKDIISDINERYSSDYMLRIIYKRLEADGIIDGDEYMPFLRDQDPYMVGYRHPRMEVYYLILLNKDTDPLPIIYVNFETRICKTILTLTRDYIMNSMNAYNKCIRI